jgi:hypothetical protein
VVAIRCESLLISAPRSLESDVVLKPMRASAELGKRRRPALRIGETSSTSLPNIAGRGLEVKTQRLGARGRQGIGKSIFVKRFERYFF